MPRTEFFVILDHFLPFYPLRTWKTNIFKKWKKCLEVWRYIILQKCIKNHDHMLHCSWDTTRDLLTPPINPKNQNFKKIKRAPGDIFILQMCTTNYDHMMHGPWDMVCKRWTDGQMDQKSDIQRRVPHLKKHYIGAHSSKKNLPKLWLLFQNIKSPKSYQWLSCNRLSSKHNTSSKVAWDNHLAPCKYNKNYFLFEKI